MYKELHLFCHIVMIIVVNCTDCGLHNHIDFHHRLFVHLTLEPTFKTLRESDRNANKGLVQ